MLSKQTQRSIAFLRVFIFACSAFIFNTTEFIPVALLSDIAESFLMTPSETGLMITVYAWVVALMSLPFMLCTARVERKRLIIYLFLLFISSHILTTVAWNFTVLLVARIGVALTHALFWSITASLVIRVAPKDKKQQALAMLALGSALAMVLGLPFGRIIGQALGWRMSFALIGFLAFIVMLLMLRWLPRLPSKNAGSFSSLPLLAKSPMLLGIYLITVVIISAHFTGYSYIEPFVLNVSQLSPELATSLLLVFGLSGFVASFLFSQFSVCYPTSFMIVMLSFIAFCQMLLLPFSQNVGVIFALVFVWGIGISGISLALQMRVLQLAPHATDVATAIYSGIYNIGIGAGALIGHQVINHWTLIDINLVGGGLALLGLLLFLALSYLHLRVAP